MQQAQQSMQQADACRDLPEQKRRCYCLWARLTDSAHAVSRGSLATAVLSGGLLVRAFAAWLGPGMPPALAGMLMLGDIALPACYLNTRKKRKDCAFWRQFNEKPSNIPGCLGA